MKNKLLTISLVFLILGIGMVSAGQYKYETPQGEAITSNYEKSQLEQHQFKFQNQYQFECKEECTFSQDGEQVQLQVKEQKKFLFFNVESKEEYMLNAEGEVTQAKYNLWSRLMNNNRIKVGI